MAAINFGVVRASGDEPRRNKYLPETKQFLVTQRIPCLQRVAALDSATEAIVGKEEEDEDGWLATAAGPPADRTGIMSMDDEPEAEKLCTESMSDGIGQDRINSSANASAPTLFDPRKVVTLEEIAARTPSTTTDGQPDNRPGSDGTSQDDDYIPDMEDFEDASLMIDDEATLVVQNPKTSAAPVAVLDHDGDNVAESIQRTRTYDLEITYDRYYQTPRVWLFGYDEDHSPLGPDQIFEDISQDHANRTVTIETHPHKSISYASIHPCRHASTMKKIVDQVVEGGKQPQVDSYLFLFLKFISAIVPTMEYDYTLSFG